MASREGWPPTARHERRVPGRSRGFVDYQAVAGLYRQGRSLPAAVLERWRQAVRPYLPSRPLVVVDVGAGTGIFARAWSNWTEAKVIGVEPVEEMIRLSGVTGRAVHFVQGVAEALPLRDARSDVVWVSTALHHFADCHAAVQEFARILRRGGRTFIRTYVPGRTEVTWADEFPGRAKWARRFHDFDELLTLFGSHGFALVDVLEVLEAIETYGTSAGWVSSMRHADSMLTALSDDEIAEGLQALRADPDRPCRLELTLVVFEIP